MHPKYMKEIAKKANGGDEEAMSLLIIGLPSGSPTDKESLKSKAKSIADEDSDDMSEDDTSGEDYEDEGLKDGILASISDLDLSGSQMKAVCRAIYTAVESGDIKPSNPGYHED